MPSAEANRPAPCIPPATFVGFRRCSIGTEEHVAVRCPCCYAVVVDSQHARICPRAGAQVNQHLPLLRAITRPLKRLGIIHYVNHSRQKGTYGWTSS